MKNKLTIFSCLVFLFVFSFCGWHCTSSNNNESSVNMNKPSIKEVIHNRSAEIMSIPGVVGIYQGETAGGEPCIKVMVEKDSSAVRSKIPKTLDGYPVIIDVTGKIVPMNKE